MDVAEVDLWVNRLYRKTCVKASGRREPAECADVFFDSHGVGRQTLACVIACVGGCRTFF